MYHRSSVKSMLPADAVSNSENRKRTRIKQPGPGSGPFIALKMSEHLSSPFSPDLDNGNEAFIILINSVEITNNCNNIESSCVLQNANLKSIKISIKLPL